MLDPWHIAPLLPIDVLVLGWLWLPGQITCGVSNF